MTIKSYPFNPVPKPNFKRKNPKRGSASRFSEKTIQAIFERDNWRCVRCGTSKDLESVPHHIIYRSQLGKGILKNGATTCRNCHDLAHEKKEVRKFFEEWQQLCLDEDGNLKE